MSAIRNLSLIPAARLAEASGRPAPRRDAQFPGLCISHVKHDVAIGRLPSVFGVLVPLTEGNASDLQPPALIRFVADAERMRYRIACLSPEQQGDGIQLYAESQDAFQAAFERFNKYHEEPHFRQTGLITVYSEFVDQAFAFPHRAHLAPIDQQAEAYQKASQAFFACSKALELEPPARWNKRQPDLSLVAEYAYANWFAARALANAAMLSETVGDKETRFTQADAFFERAYFAATFLENDNYQKNWWIAELCIDQAQNGLHRLENLIQSGLVTVNSPGYNAEHERLRDILHYAKSYSEPITQGELEGHTEGFIISQDAAAPVVDAFSPAWVTRKNNDELGPRTEGVTASLEAPPPVNDTFSPARATRQKSEE